MWRASLALLLLPALAGAKDLTTPVDHFLLIGGAAASTPAQTVDVPIDCGHARRISILCKNVGANDLDWLVGGRDSVDTGILTTVAPYATLAPNAVGAYAADAHYRLYAVAVQATVPAANSLIDCYGACK